jgi:EAL domain-containing protein (putative c-di-GMP-specific phosphodiesterase class I)
MASADPPADHLAVSMRPGVTPLLRGAIEPFLDADHEPEIDEWADALQGAIDQDEIEVVYQPKVRLTDGLPVGFEALARWTHPSRGEIGPDRFIPIADATRLIGQLTDRVVARAVADCAAWTAAGHDLTVAVNLPAPILTSAPLLERLLAVLAAHGLPATSVTLEVTESTAFQNSLASMALLSRLRLRGFSLSIDDFGTGYSSLSLLHQMPFNELKIDRSFIADIESSRISRVIVQTLATLARRLGLTTVAEGVEHLESWDWLRYAGIEQAQGFGIAKPMPANQVPVWLAQWPGIAPT